MNAFGSMGGMFMGSAAPGGAPMYGNSQMGPMGAPMGAPMANPYGSQNMGYGSQQFAGAGVMPGQPGQPGSLAPGTSQNSVPGQTPGLPLSQPPPVPQPQKLYVQTTAIESAATMAATAHISFLWTMMALAGGVALGLTCGLYKRSRKGGTDEKKDNEDEDDDSSSSSSSDSE